MSPVPSGWLSTLQREAEIAAAINLLAMLGLIGLWIWAVIWCFRAFARWEQREEAKLRALQRIAAKMPELKQSTGDEIRATR